MAVSAEHEIHVLPPRAACSAAPAQNAVRTWRSVLVDEVRGAGRSTSGRSGQLPSSRSRGNATDTPARAARTWALRVAAISGVTSRSGSQAASAGRYVPAGASSRPKAAGSYGWAYSWGIGIAAPATGPSDAHASRSIARIVAARSARTRPRGRRSPRASTTPNWTSWGCRTYGARATAAGSASVQHQARKPIAPRPRLDQHSRRSWAAIRSGSNWVVDAPNSWTMTGCPAPDARAVSYAAARVMRGPSSASG